jgi:hypothetical protein
MGGIMRVLIAFSAITLIAVMSFVTVPAFAAKSCDEYCLGACQTAASKSWCLSTCGQKCRMSHPGH